MVTSYVARQAVAALFAAAAPGEPVLEQLDPPRRVAVVMAILAIALVGLLLVACTMLGANWVRRLARHQPRPRREEPDKPSTAAQRALREALEGIVPDGDAKETIHMPRATGETKIDP